MYIIVCVLKLVKGLALKQSTYKTILKVTCNFDYNSFCKMFMLKGTHKIVCHQVVYYEHVHCMITIENIIS